MPRLLTSVAERAVGVLNRAKKRDRHVTASYVCAQWTLTLYFQYRVNACRTGPGNWHLQTGITSG
jgi:hypothetical protein